MKLIIPKAVPLEQVQAAAYALTDRAIAYVEEVAQGWEVTLLAKGELAEAFHLALANQALRHKLRANNQAILEYVIPRALAPALNADLSGDEEGLTPESRRQIKRLLAEAAAELVSGKPADPLGIARTWEEVHAKAR